ncbi:MAG TPA: tetratricopeptide repeat protein [Kofleriaceae bacterium]|jgi:serine/threonine-protein kinase
MLGRSRAVAAGVAAVLVASPVFAQPTQPTQAQQNQARPIVVQAMAKAKAGQHEDAIALYVKAYGIASLSLLLTNIANEYKELDRKEDALKYFCMYLEKDPTGNNAQFARDSAKAMWSSLSNGKAPLDSEVCTVSPLPKPPPPPVVVTPPVQPPPPPPVATESHPGKGLRISGLVMAGIGVVGLGLGGYYGFKGSDVADQINNHKGGWTDGAGGIKDLQDRGHHDNVLQATFMVGGGVLLVGGVVIYMVGRSKASSTEHVAVAPVVTNDSAGLVLGGSF